MRAPVRVKKNVRNLVARACNVYSGQAPEPPLEILQKTRGGSRIPSKTSRLASGSPTVAIEEPLEKRKPKKQNQCKRISTFDDYCP